jgi:hypothetical protein
MITHKIGSINTNKMDMMDYSLFIFTFSSKWNQNSRGMDQAQSEPTAASAPSLGSLWW